MQNHRNSTLEYFVILTLKNDSYNIRPTLLDGQSNRLAGEVWMAFSLWHRLDKLCNHHPGDPRSFLDPHCRHRKMKCQWQHIWHLKREENETRDFDRNQNLLLFCNQIITLINHAETHSNTWYIRMINVTHCISYLSFSEMHMCLFCVTCSIHLHFNNILLTFFLGNPCLKFNRRTDM